MKLVVLIGPNDQNRQLTDVTLAARNWLKSLKLDIRPFYPDLSRAPTSMR